MARRPAQTEDIVFEDLHGVADDGDQTLEVDFDSADGDGITVKKGARTSSEEGTPTDDDVQFDDLRSDLRGTPADDDAGDDDGGDDRGRDDDRYSRKFQARLDRERRAKRRAQEESDEKDRENARLRKKLKKAQERKGDDNVADLERQVRETETALEKAIEDGKTSDQVRLTSTLTDLKAKRIAADYVTDDDDDDDDDLDDDRSTTRRSRRQDNTLADEWRDDQADWYGRPGFERQTRVANRMDKEVFDDGFRPDEPEYFEELNRRLGEKFPDLLEFDADADDRGDDPGKGDRRTRQRQSGKKGRTPVASADDASRDGSQRRSNRNKVELGPDEFANMRRFGLDPKNPAHVKEYAANKRQIESEENA